jgi:hypothetical protein
MHRHRRCDVMCKGSIVKFKHGGFIRARMRKSGDMIRDQIRILYLLFVCVKYCHFLGRHITGPDQGFLVSPLVLILKTWERGCISTLEMFDTITQS